MADLALNQVSNKEVSTLSVNEYRRLSIAMELVRDPGTVKEIPDLLTTL